jgi:hypothetical protein
VCNEQLCAGWLDKSGVESTKISGQEHVWHLGVWFGFAVVKLMQYAMVRLEVMTQYNTWLFGILLFVIYCSDSSGVQRELPQQQGLGKTF